MNEMFWQNILVYAQQGRLAELDINILNQALQGIPMRDNQARMSYPAPQAQAVINQDAQLAVALQQAIQTKMYQAQQANMQPMNMNPQMYQQQMAQPNPADDPNLSKKDKKKLAKAAKKNGTGTADKKKKISKPIIITIVIAAILCVLGFGLSGLIIAGVIDDDTVAAVQKGQLPDRSESQQQAEANRQIAEGMFDISIAPIIRYDDANGWKVDLSNTPANHYTEQVTIRETSTGDLLFESPMIAPDEYVQYAKFQKSVDEIDWSDDGTANATATFTTYDSDGNKKNSTDTSVKLRKPVE